MKPRPRVPLPVYCVRVDPHAIPPRWTIPKHTIKLVATGTRDARLCAIRWAHTDAGVPPWRPLIRVSWPHTSAKLLPPRATDSAALYPAPKPREREPWTDRIAA